MEAQPTSQETPEKSTSFNKRGNIPPQAYTVLAMFGVIVLGAVFALVLTTLEEVDNDSTFGQIITDGLGLFTGFFGQLPTIGKILGVVILVAVVGGSGLMGYDYYQRRRSR